MIIKDKIYSKFEITSPIVLELINTKAFQRLKNIGQFCVPDKYYHLEGYSRYEHSIGVYILLNKLGASEEEQIAGLLHDVSHTAFSHLIDWIVGNISKEDFQDRRHLSVLKEKEIAKILGKYGFILESIADCHKFGLLDRDMPDLCADRIDYALRESDEKIAKQCFLDLKVVNGEIVFSSETNALLFAENFLDRQTKNWASYEGTTRCVLLADIFKKAIKNKTIILEDFFEKTDDFIIDKIIKANKKEYLDVLDLLKKKNLSFLAKSKVSVKRKFRYVDPKILMNGKMVTLSAINEKFDKKLKRAKKLNDQGIYYGITI